MATPPPVPPVPGLVWFEDGDTHLATYGEGVAGVPVDRSGSGYAATRTWYASSVLPGATTIPNDGHAILHPQYVAGQPYEYGHLDINYPAGADYTEIWVIPGGIYGSLSYLQGNTLLSMVADGVGLDTDAASRYAVVSASGYWLSLNTVAGESMNDPYLVVGVDVEWSTGNGMVRINAVPTPAYIWAATYSASLVFYSYTRPSFAHLIYNRILTQAEHEQIQDWVASWSAPLTPPTPVSVARSETGVTLSWSTGATLSGATRFSETATGAQDFRIVVPVGAFLQSPYTDASATDMTTAYAYNLRFDDQTNAVVGVPVDTRTRMNVTTSDITYSTVTLTWDGPAGQYELKRDGVVVNPLATSPYTETELADATSFLWDVGSATHVGNVTAFTPPRPASQTYVSSGGQWLLVPGSGTVDHSALLDRDAVGSHPISAITGLQEALDTKSNTNHKHPGIASVYAQASAPGGVQEGDIWIDL